METAGAFVPHAVVSLVALMREFELPMDVRCIGHGLAATCCYNREMFGKRSIARVLRASVHSQHYRAIGNMFRVYKDVPDAIGRYLFQRGTYPADVVIKTPVGLQTAHLYSFHDMLTLNEVFCRNDYPADSSLRVVLDVGSNIGISALYFLTRNRHSRCYLFEPSPNNVHRLRRQLAPFEGRYELAECAVADRDGEVTFGVEPTGRYGGIDVETGQSITVACRHINGVLAEILEKEGSIDIIKIDTEGAEISTVKAMDARLLESVRSIFLEAAPDESLREGMFGQRHCVSIAQLRNLKAVRPYAGEAKRQAMASSMR